MYICIRIAKTLFMKVNNKVWLMFTLVAVFFVSCSHDKQWRHAGGAVWGTTYNIVYEGNEDLADSIMAVMKKIENAVSIFDKNSNVSLINSGKTDTVSDIFAEVFIKSRRISLQSHGAFDPTVAPLVKLWGFGPDKTVSAPDSQMVEWMRERVGIADCRIDANRRIVRKHPRTEFDFSAIAKGYGVDCVADMLRKHGCRNFMVEIGGELSLSGHNERAERWHVQIDDPVNSGQDCHARLLVASLTDCALATSGNYRNFHTLADGRRVSHTISPATGYSAETDLLSVSIVAPKCMVADALATACMAMPLEQARQFVRGQKGVSALFVVCPQDGAVRLETAGPDVFGVGEKVQ